MLIRNLLLMLAMTLISGCETKIISYPAFCAIGQPIYPSRQDILTEGTQRQVLEHNMVGAALCGWSPKNK